MLEEDGGLGSRNLGGGGQWEGRSWRRFEAQSRKRDNESEIIWGGGEMD